VPRYEMLMMFKTNFEADSMDTLVVAIEKALDAHQAKMLRGDKMGRKKIAHLIGKHKEALMAVVGFDMAADQVSSLSRMLRLNEDLLRFMIVRNDKLDPEKPFNLNPITGKEPREPRRPGAGGGRGGFRGGRRRDGEEGGDEQPREPRGERPAYGDRDRGPRRDSAARA
jgi:small subunit ribosomal protein S6